jgi:hypothetical protein
MPTFIKTLTTSLFFLVNYCLGQSKSFEVAFYPSFCDSCKTKIIDTNIDYNSQYFNLKHSIIEFALDKALMNNDKRIVAISGVSDLFPGLETKNSKLKAKYEKHLKMYGYKVIWGTSDVVYSNLPIQNAAYEYALKYNTLLFKRLIEN